jgi:hypothetical protein
MHRLRSTEIAREFLCRCYVQKGVRMDIKDIRFWDRPLKSCTNEQLVEMLEKLKWEEALIREEIEVRAKQIR